MSSGTSSEIVGNCSKSHLIAMMGARLESVNQVFRNAHIGFLSLVDVSCHVIMSDFSYDT